MKKEEIVRDEYEKMFGTQKYDNSVNRKMNFQYFSPAMDQYTKQEAIAFAEWCGSNEYYYDADIKGWLHHGKDPKPTLRLTPYATEELHTLYLQSK